MVGEGGSMDGLPVAVVYEIEIGECHCCLERRVQVGQRS
jgi:hypothetical protein